MHSFITYSFQVTLIQILFLGIYYLLFRKETFFLYNRLYLLGSVFFSFVVPTISVSNLGDSNQVIQLNEIVLSNFNKYEITSIVQNELKTNNLFFYFYLLGLILSAILFFIKIFKIWKIKSESEEIMYQSNKIYLHEQPYEAFTFLNFVFIGKNNDDIETILKHELVHRLKKHSFDLLILEIASILFWFNPILKVYQNSLAEVHEFEADALVVSNDKGRYFETILNQMFQLKNWSITNNFFNKSLIKKRIFMLQKSKSPKKALIKYVLVVPMMFLSILLFSRCIENDDENHLLDRKSNSNRESESSWLDNDTIVSFVQFGEVDEAPRFKDCEKAGKEVVLKCFNEQMNLHIMKNFTYPEMAAEGNIQGRVNVQFIIDKEGNVTDIMAKGPKNGLLLEKEAIRLIKILPQFIPAKLKGKCVNVRYGLPITFKLI
ncbi:putative Energy transducer TonB [Flavobacterium sp. 9AF]|uniref:M56 family metallopeptidase n=1 Tax=Flavobacterium sp. 9AF TaxID=2653142 RepID=UPI0012EF885E|nr:M56 family metallopeptidase [Flavobacterium sp. 9AF]VXB22198.1 putative Energy transducer TonB [Flavobacterium sp. 9AF]